MLDGFLDADRCAALRAAVRAAEVGGLALEATPCGDWRDVVPGELVGLEALEGRVRALVGAADDEVVVRLRRYHPGQSHPPHEDRYALEDRQLYATALVVLEAPGRGGETRFPRAAPRRVAVRPLEGRLVAWWGFTPDGEPDVASTHDAAEVVEGRKLTLTFFFYARLTVERLEGPPGARRFLFVDDRGPETTRRLVREAALARGLDWRHVPAARADFEPGRRGRPGDLLYNAGASARAAWVEQHLAGPGVATVHRGPLGPHSGLYNPRWAMARGGVPTPDLLPLTSGDRALLRRWGGRLGGPPWVVRMGGGEGGVGTLRVDSWPALFSLVDHALATGVLATLSRYVADGTVWRVVVVGDTPVAAYRNPIRADDFRSEAPDDPADHAAPAPPEVLEVAVRATAVCGVELGGVDVIVGADDRPLVLEVNTPCYFGHAQLEGGVDVAGALVDRLLALAR